MKRLKFLSILTIFFVCFNLNSAEFLKNKAESLSDVTLGQIFNGIKNSTLEQKLGVSGLSVSILGFVNFLINACHDYSHYKKLKDNGKTEDKNPCGHTIITLEHYKQGAIIDALRAAIAFLTAVMTSRMLFKSKLTQFDKVSAAVSTIASIYATIRSLIKAYKYRNESNKLKCGTLIKLSNGSKFCKTCYLNWQKWDNLANLILSIPASFLLRLAMQKS